MTALQASTSYGVGISTFVTSPRLRLHHRHVITAQVEPSDKSVEIMRKFSEQYARKSGTYFCVDKGVTSVVIKVVPLNLDLGISSQLGWVFIPVTSKGLSPIPFDDVSTNTQFNPLGLADHKDSLGAPLCPCRHYDDKAAEAGQGFWNCPCVPMREGRSVTACSFSPLITILLAQNRPFHWKKSKKQQQICSARI
ncbi:hypothetical protein HYC85_006092 [Camellia sinensis]|uniref:Ferredoxin-thioredoxin reductase catalytic chain, chloroplastic n=1 Tax=Camellia sinensis TaxID=4442 RepID=A0A7J7I2J2_CAMSI|nr:hypothetical protein HYC85_006092 [Camellia sinensis]